MPNALPRPMRSDARRNRDRLLDAGRELFAERGGQVPLEEVARVAGVSRTTLHRHFADRKELAETVYEDNVARIEHRAAELAGRSDGARELFDFVLDSQVANRGFASVLSGADLGWFRALSNRTATAFDGVLNTAREAGELHAGVETADVMLAFPMAAGAFDDDDSTGQDRSAARVRAMLHRALFTAGDDR